MTNISDDPTCGKAKTIGLVIDRNIEQAKCEEKIKRIDNEIELLIKRYFEKSVLTDLMEFGTLYHSHLCKNCIFRERAESEDQNKTQDLLTKGYKQCGTSSYIETDLCEHASYDSEDSSSLDCIYRVRVGTSESYLCTGKGWKLI